MGNVTVDADYLTYKEKRGKSHAHPVPFRREIKPDAGTASGGRNAILLEEIRPEILEKPVTVHNFQVADFHIYHVGRVGVLVHNAGNGYGERGSKTNGVGNPVDIAGKGSTGRTVPNNINKQMAMHQVQSIPLDGWVKMQSIVTTSNGTKNTIHFVYNKITDAFDDFKFK